MRGRILVAALGVVGTLLLTTACGSSSSSSSGSDATSTTAGGTTGGGGDSTATTGAAVAANGSVCDSPGAASGGPATPTTGPKLTGATLERTAEGLRVTWQLDQPVASAAGTTSLVAVLTTSAGEHVVVVQQAPGGQLTATSVPVPDPAATALALPDNVPHDGFTTDGTTATLVVPVSTLSDDAGQQLGWQAMVHAGAWTAEGLPGTYGPDYYPVVCLGRSAVSL